MIVFRNGISTQGMVSATKTNALASWRERIAAFCHYGRVEAARVAAVIAAAETLEACAIPFLLVLKAIGFKHYGFRIVFPRPDLEAAAKLALADQPAAVFRRDHKRLWVKRRLAQLTAEGNDASLDNSAASSSP